MLIIAFFVTIICDLQGQLDQTVEMWTLFSVVR